VAVAVEDAKEGGERTHIVSVTTGEDPGDLMEMREVVRGPGREEF
jgi:hypothetical protein